MFDKVYLIKSISAVTNYNSSFCFILGEEKLLEVPGSVSVKVEEEQSCPAGAKNSISHVKPVTNASVFLSFVMPGKFFFILGLIIFTNEKRIT